jgi:hypothetical protein
MAAESWRERRIALGESGWSVMPEGPRRRAVFQQDLSEGHHDLLRAFVS